MKIRWKQGARLKASAAKAHDEIEQVRRDNDGFVDLEAIISRSRDKSAPLHADFEWRDDVAAHEYRLTQARYIVRSLEVVYDESPVSTRAYETVTIETGERAYTSTREALANVDWRDELLKQALSDIARFRRKYQALSELSGALEALTGAHRRIEARLSDSQHVHISD